MTASPYRFDPRLHEESLRDALRAVDAAESLDEKAYHRIVRRFPKAGGRAFTKSELIRGLRWLAPRAEWADRQAEMVAKLRMKPIRTASGVAPVTVLTKPFPCPGKCIFCPNDVRMPKSYLTREPGAQRAAQHEFDPFTQTLGRLLALYNTGHEVDKVEMIILGGTWSFYPEAYQIWFVKRCFDAMNVFEPALAVDLQERARPVVELDLAALEDEIDGREIHRTYNQIVRDRLGEDAAEQAAWSELEEVQTVNERRHARCVGLVLETRPDHLDDAEVRRLRRLGATKVQIGIQSLSDEVLAKNKRGHDVAATRRALLRLRGAGFKLHAHWMPNLHGSSPAADIEDFRRLFADPAVRPDELKVYPCSLIESAELMREYEAGTWRPYTQGELLEVLVAAMLEVPRYCRVTRMIRDIPGDDILVGNKVTNFREVVSRELEARGAASRDIRAREVRDLDVDPETLRLARMEYSTSLGREIFFEWLTPDDRLAGFCRLALPSPAGSSDEEPSGIEELCGAALLREVHVYGVVVAIGERAAGRSQHLGLGRRLVDAAAREAAVRGYANLAVISSIGTREYYRRLGFVDGELYQHLALSPSTSLDPECGPPGLVKE